MTNDKNLRRLGMVATAVLTAVTVGGCVVHPGAPGAIDPVSTAAQESQGPTHNGEFWEQVDYSKLAHTYDWAEPGFELFNPCTDELYEVYRSYGIEMYRHFDVPFRRAPWLVSSTCRSDDPDRSMNDYEITVEPINRENLQQNTTAFRSDVAGGIVPGAYFAHNTIIDPEQRETNCQVRVDTVRGTVAVTHASLLDEEDLELHCDLALELFERLFQDEEFLRALYGDDLPMKNDKKGPQ
ncbi:hypothetical protein C1Y63_06755 [Corynebacterium sp. 13CS0277]|uniref:hypothetical protein n=1 Tax=Corynebacterium sp. 13CS0277 TaxID=2071994 RepID=UPI000D040609|nr:hypothetical protein [Corynebacterium sp. 13CS0277]PRQ11248.1 hypothetical protein C1Y63_06755 [Corynebacterium sp. 13CS0277]